jgi:integrase
MYKRIFRQKDSRVYRVRFRLSDGPRIYDLPLRTHLKEVAEVKAKGLIDEKEKESAGMLDAKPLRDAAQKPLSAHHSDFIANLVARGRNKDHVIHARNRLIRLFAECGWHQLRDITADSVEKWLSAQTEFSPKTLNEYIAHAKTFANWLENQGRLPVNPLRRVGKIPTEGRETFKRRALKLEEFLGLLSHSGPRRTAYALAVLTGLRRGELKRLLWADVHLDDPKPWIEVRAATTKNKRPATMFLVPQLVSLLREIRGAGIGLVLPGGVPGVDKLEQDLVAAGVPVKDERGWRVDFHALRHTYASLLGAAGVSEGARVKMVRHSEWRQTDHYTDPNSVPLHAGMEKLCALLPSSLASPNSGKMRPRQRKAVQTSNAQSTAEVVACGRESPVLASAVQSWEDDPLASPRGFEPRFSP